MIPLAVLLAVSLTNSADEIVVVDYGYEKLSYNISDRRRKLNDPRTREPWQSAKWIPDDPVILKLRKEIASMSVSQLRVTRLKFSRIYKEQEGVYNWFGWSYSLWRGTVLGDKEAKRDAHFAYDQLDKLPRNYSYNLARVRFLVTLLEFPSELRFIGLRLIEHNPKDYAIMLRLVNQLDPLFREDRIRAIEYTRQLIALNSKKSLYYMLRSDWYTSCYRTLNLKEYAKSALKYYDLAIQYSIEEEKSELRRRRNLLEKDFGMNRAIQQNFKIDPPIE